MSSVTSELLSFWLDKSTNSVDKILALALWPILRNSSKDFGSFNSFLRTYFLFHWQIQGAPPGARLPPPPPNRINFFHFCISFCRKVYVSEVGAPPNGSAPPPTGNPGSATVFSTKCKKDLQMSHPNSFRCFSFKITTPNKHMKPHGNITTGYGLHTSDA